MLEIYRTRMHFSRMRTARLLTISRNAGGVSEDSFGQTPRPDTPPPVDRILDFLTHTCEHITTVAGGNEIYFHLF